MKSLPMAAPLALLVALAWLPASANLHETSSFERIRAVRAQLEPDHAHDRGLERLQRRAAPTGLDVLVVGCDFSDSLMVGRDLADFPSWPAQRRNPQVIPPDPDFPTETPIFAFDAHDSAFFDLQMQRVDDYFRTVSFGRFDLRWDVYGDIVNLPQAMGYYGAEDSAGVRAVELARDVIAAIDAEVDFSGYDTLVLIHAGAGQETDVNGDSPAQIFSNYLDRRDFELAVDAGKIDDAFLATEERAVEHVLILPEAQAQDPPSSNGLGGFFDVRGVYAFEFGLRMGMLSLADFTPGSFPDSQGIGNFGLMGYGLFTGLGTVPAAPSAMNRYLMGWVDAVDVREDADLRLGAMGPEGDAVSDTLLVRVPITDREYWLVEYRLQDPNGDLFYSFPGKEPDGGGNGNNLPDWFDADSQLGDGRPTSAFDFATDTWEDELGAEWDWFMSENPARTPDGCQRAGGSGLYIWHVDERVIQDALESGSNTINADATRKGVDLEEADGIQDLDNLRGGVYLLGSDVDTWRAEGGNDFGPATLPNTDSNDGVPTGIRFHDMSTVIADSLPKFEFGGSLFCSGFVYRTAMTFSVSFGASDGDGPVATGVARLDGRAPLADLRAFDLGTSPDDATLDGAAELVAPLDLGGLAVWTAGTDAWSGSDAVLVTFADSNVVAQPLAVSERNGDTRPDLVLALGGVVRVVEADGFGVLVRDPGREETVVSPIVADGDLLRWVTRTEDGFFAYRKSRFEGGGGFGGDVGEVDGGLYVDAGATPGYVVAIRDSSAGSLSIYEADGDPLRSVEAPSGILTHTLTGLALEGGATAVAWVDGDGFLHLTPFDPAQPDRVSIEAGLPASAPSIASVSDGGPTIIALTLGDALHVLDVNLRTRTNFPYSPPRVGEFPRPGSRVRPPAMVDLDGDGRVELVWHEAAGTVHAVDLDGRLRAGWPLAGPAEPVSTPVVADLDGDGDFDLAVAGRFDRIVSIDAPDRDFVSVPAGALHTWDLQVPVSAYAPWTQAGGDAGNRAVAALSSVAGDPGDGALRLYPNPTVDGRVRVRIPVARSGDVEVEIRTLEGESVVRVGPFAVIGGGVFEQEIDLGGAVSGLYLCSVSSPDGEERAVLTVVR